MFKPKGMLYLALVFTLLLFGCSGPEPDQPLLTAEMPLHLEDHLDDARIEGSKIPEDIHTPFEWDFSEPQPGWQPAKPIPPQWRIVKPVRVDDALHIPLTGANRHLQSSRLVGAIYVELPDLNFEDWAYVEISARTRDPMSIIRLWFNYTEQDPHYPLFPFYSQGATTRFIADGTAQTYQIPIEPLRWPIKRSWTHLGIAFGSQPGEEAVTLDILSVRIIPKENIYADAPAGVRSANIALRHRRALYTHAPGRIEYRVRIPQAGRLDVGLGVLRDNVPVNFRITAKPEGDKAETVLEGTYANRQSWAQRSIDLSSMAGKTVSIALEADAERVGTVALWGAPTLTGARATDKPNIIFYVIDAVGADSMSVYGYNRRTTPNLERLAAEGALFEHAYSNSTWTGISNPSFMTSLHSSVLGGGKGSLGEVILPKGVVTMAQHMHRASYQTAVFTMNGFAADTVGLERYVDVLSPGYEMGQPSSVNLHKDYWKWREAYPNEPYWVHFQTTEVHWSFHMLPSFEGLYVSPELRERYSEWERRLEEAEGIGLALNPNEAALAKVGIDPVLYAYVRCARQNEAMASQDYMLGRFVERLKATGEWEHTLLIVASDHFGMYYNPAGNNNPMFRSQMTRIPLLIVWPGHIAGGQRFSQTVSMIDILPTLLDLVDLPMPEVMQGQSLAPLLLEEEGWEQRPVILDEFGVDRETGEINGYIEVVDGRWGASLQINPNPRNQRTVPLLLYDLWDDPYTQHSLHEERPDLVEKYTKFLEAQFEAHRNLSKLFSPSGKAALTPEQLEALRSLGYID